MRVATTSGRFQREEKETLELRRQIIGDADRPVAPVSHACRYMLRHAIRLFQ